MVLNLYISCMLPLSVKVVGPGPLVGHNLSKITDGVKKLEEHDCQVQSDMKQLQHDVKELKTTVKELKAKVN